jgi:predicted ATP-grasp superfamily ATP-dependent carboligase
VTRVIVTDGEQRAALAAVRSLGAAGHEVYVCSSRPESIAAASRYCAGSHQVHDALSSPDDFVSDVQAVAASRTAAVLLPVSEGSLLAVLPRRERFKCAIPFSAAQSFVDICDKRIVLERATNHGVQVPQQTVIPAKEDISALTNDFRYPVVVKPSRSVAGLEGDRVKVGVAYASDARALRYELNRIPANAYPLLVQQRIIGEGFGISVLVWDGELIAAFAHRRLREKPPTGGVSVLRESIPLNHDLLSRSLALLEDFQWRGVAMVEYKLDEQAKKPYLMEINGRLWGSLQLAIDAGVNFPDLLVQLALGKKPAPVTTYKLGVRSRWEWGDVDNLISSVLHPSRTRAAFPDAPERGRLRAIADFVRGFSRANQPEIFRIDDLGPILRETADWIRRR